LSAGAVGVPKSPFVGTPARVLFAGGVVSEATAPVLSAAFGKGARFAEAADGATAAWSGWTGAMDESIVWIEFDVCPAVELARVSTDARK
jgi:hypothetical protein